MGMHKSDHPGILEAMCASSMCSLEIEAYLIYVQSDAQTAWCIFFPCRAHCRLSYLTTSLYCSVLSEARPRLKQLRQDEEQ